jgi:hypothetical protein
MLLSTVRNRAHQLVGRGGRAADSVRAWRRTAVGWGVKVAAWRRWVTGRGIGVGARLVAEAKAGGLAPVGVSESRAWRPGRSSRGGGRGWREGGRRPRHADLSRVREREAGVCNIFLDKAIISISHP